MTIEKSSTVKSQELPEEESVEDSFIHEQRDIDFQAAYCKPQPVFMTIKGLGLYDKDQEKFQQKLNVKLESYDYEEFDGFELKDYKALTP